MCKRTCQPPTCSKDGKYIDSKWEALLCFFLRGGHLPKWFFQYLPYGHGSASTIKCAYEINRMDKLIERIMSILHFIQVDTIHKEFNSKWYVLAFIEVLYFMYIYLSLSLSLYIVYTSIFDTGLCLCHVCSQSSSIILHGCMKGMLNSSLMYISCVIPILQG